jgi:hypothetical protein
MKKVFLIYGGIALYFRFVARGDFGWQDSLLWPLTLLRYLL